MCPNLAHGSGKSEPIRHVFTFLACISDEIRMVKLSGNCSEAAEGQYFFTQCVAGWRNPLPGDIGVPKGMNGVKKESDAFVRGMSIGTIKYSHSDATFGA